MTDQPFDRGEKEFDAQVAEQKTYVDAIYEVAKGSITRSREASQGVQTAAAAIGTLYAGVLGLVFSVTDNPLPPRGLITPAFLGLAVVLANVYSAYLTKVTTQSLYPSDELHGWLVDSRRRLNAFVTYSKVLVQRRSLAMRCSVLALGGGLVFIVAPFVTFSNTADVTPTAPAASAPAFPLPDPSSSTPTKLDEIRYQAQINEAAEIRKASLASSTNGDASGWTDEDRVWCLAAGAYALLGLVVAGITRNSRT